MSLLLALQVAGGPTNYSDSLSAGSYAISGKSISDSVVRSDSLSKGTYTLTGISLTDKVVRGDSLSAGSYIVSGKALTDSVVRGDSLSNGIYTISGKTVSDSVVRSDQLSKGSYVVTGFNVNDVITTAGGTSYSDLLSAGSYLLTGNNLNDVITILPLQEYTGGGSSYYISYTYEEELEILREKARHKTFVKQAAIQAITQNYYAPKSKIDTSGLKILKSIANDLEIELDKNDKLLLKLEIKHILALRDLDDEETILLL